MSPAQVRLKDQETAWMEDYLHGRWSALLTIDGSELARSIRWRAELMLGHSEMESPDARGNTDFWIQINTDICRAHLNFVRGEFSRALYHANKAFLRAKKNGVRELVADAGFYRALCLSELGEKYSALALYTQLRKSNRLTSYRQNLIITNESCLLWDLGLIEPLKEILPKVPEPFHSRMHMMMGLLTEGASFFKSALHKLGYYLTLPQLEKENTFLLLTEGLFIFATESEKSLFFESLFFKDIKSTSESPLVRYVVGLCSGDVTNVVLEGRDLVDGSFIKTLSQLQTDPERARILYFEELQPSLKREKYHSLLIPTEQSLRNPHYAWEKILSEKLLQSESRLPKLELSSSAKALRFGENTIALSKSPMTWKLMEAFKLKPSLRKEEIHGVLTHNRYRSDLHDTRIFKLVQRMNAKTKEEFGFEICRFNGGNELELCAELIWVTK